MQTEKSKAETPKPECRSGDTVRVRKVRGPAEAFNRRLFRFVTVGGVYETTAEIAAALCAAGGEFELLVDRSGDQSHT
jgi:hypothetical protein